jgi:hypothetical protein
MFVSKIQKWILIVSSVVILWYLIISSLDYSGPNFSTILTLMVITCFLFIAFMKKKGNCT